LEAARLRPPRHAARVYKEVFRTVSTADSCRAPRVDTRQFDSNLPLHSTPKTNQTIPSLGIYPVTIQSETATVCVPTATVDDTFTRYLSRHDHACQRRPRSVYQRPPLPSHACEVGSNHYSILSANPSHDPVTNSRVMAFQLVCNFFGQSSPSRSGAYEPVVESGSFGNQGGIAHYDTRDVGRTAKDFNWFELARQDKETNGQKGRKPYNGAQRGARVFSPG